jgi:hypothetical protein
MTLPLDPADRLIKLCSLLGSAHVGERAAAGLKADELVRQLGLTWPDVIVAPPIAPDPPRRTEPDWHRLIMFCHARRERLEPRERDFIQSMFGSWRGTPTKKQQDWLMDLYALLYEGPR